MSLPRPMPTLPRGRRQRAEATTCVIAVPVVSPQRAVHERRVLVKPHDWTREAVVHRAKTDAGDPQFEQPWDDGRAARVAAAATEAARRLAVELTSIETADRLAYNIPLPPADPRSLAVAACASAASAGTWVTLSAKLASRDGRFWRRERGRLLNFRPAGDLHLTRDVRAAVRDLLRRRG